MKVSEKVAAAIKDISEIRTEVYNAAKAEMPLPPIKYLFFLERVTSDFEEVAREYGKYDALVKNNRAAHFVSIKVESEKSGAKFEKGSAEIQAEGLVAEERVARNYFEAVKESAEKLIQTLKVHLEIFQKTPGASF